MARIVLIYCPLWAHYRLSATSALTPERLTYYIKAALLHYCRHSSKCGRDNRKIQFTTIAAYSANGNYRILHGRKDKCSNCRDSGSPVAFGDREEKR